MRFWHQWKWKQRIVFILSILALLLYAFTLPSRLFEDPFCTLIKDKNGELLGAHVAEDGQYRFPPSEHIPEKFKHALLTFEDKGFYFHWGVDIAAVARAVKQNLQAGKIVSGGSTITMQVIRLARKKTNRSFWEKCIEMIWATRLEFRYSKKSILKLYASHAPFGGNVVGLEAASWRYFDTPPDKLSWAQAATLAVLPNSPALIHPGRNRKALLVKRNRLLKRLWKRKIIDQETLQLALDEEIPDSPVPFPQHAPHLLMLAKKQNKNLAQTSVDIQLQQQINKISEKHLRKLSGNHIHNLAALVLEVETGKVLAYVGNLPLYENKQTGNDVDMIQAARSTGSILKPFLYASMLSEGMILPQSLVFDFPMRMGNFSPKNYDRGYSGVVPADRALARSLNIPAAYMLRDYGQEKFYYKLKKIGMTTLPNPPEHYGLSLILGGCEGSLWEITGIYASMARSLNHFSLYKNMYDLNDYHPPEILKETPQRKKDETPYGYFSAAAIYSTFQAMLKLERPSNTLNDNILQSSEPIAWKTGTSFGFRDAWAVGVTPLYAVGVWAGNADGEGRPGLVGVKAAAPLLFDIFDLLPDAEQFFSKPTADMLLVETCPNSGHITSEFCPEKQKRYIPKNGLRSKVCPYHKRIHLDLSEKFRVNADCEDLSRIKNVSWFVLPPAAEIFYQKNNSNYKPLPPLREDCKKSTPVSSNDIQILYPFENTKIMITKDLDGKKGRVVFEAAHRKKTMQLFWYVDENFVGTTSGKHRIELMPERGKHLLTIMDENGLVRKRSFEIAGTKKKKKVDFH